MPKTPNLDRNISIRSVVDDDIISTKWSEDSEEDSWSSNSVENQSDFLNETDDGWETAKTSFSEALDNLTERR